ncbi:hypothetical protein PO909_008843 [Leuciscus waleckii]
MRLSLRKLSQSPPVQPPEGTPSPVSVPAAMEDVSEQVSRTVHKSPEPISLARTLPSSSVMAPEFIPKSFPNQEFIAKTVSDTQGCFQAPTIGASPCSQENL